MQSYFDLGNESCNCGLSRLHILFGSGDLVQVLIVNLRGERRTMASMLQLPQVGLENTLVSTRGSCSSCLGHNFETDKSKVQLGGRNRSTARTYTFKQNVLKLKSAPFFFFLAVFGRSTLSRRTSISIRCTFLTSTGRSHVPNAFLFSLRLRQAFVFRKSSTS
jgi:hypothetical protein